MKSNAIEKDVMNGGKKECWFDIRALKLNEINQTLPVVFNCGYDAVMVFGEQMKLMDKWPKGISVLINIDQGFNVTVDELKVAKNNRKIVLYSKSKEMLAKYPDFETGLYSIIKDKESMMSVIGSCNSLKNIIIEFESETNIPLELVLAYSQKNNSRICKLIKSANDGWVSSMTMEMGSHSVLLGSKNPEEIVNLKNRIVNLTDKCFKMTELKVEAVRHVGMGDRVCIDTISTLEKDEGMIIGSTSQGGILISSETHFLPYMDLRPFRVNAGAVHSYVWCPNDNTKYLSELHAGDEVLAVKANGRVRTVAIGRIKMEKRPMLLIEASTSDGVHVNTIVQDDWHIRIITQDGNVKNSTLLKTGDIVLGYLSDPGRHLGVKINETITEK